MVSSTAPPRWESPVMRVLIREENREGSSPLSTELPSFSMPVMEAKAGEKYPVTGA